MTAGEKIRLQREAYATALTNHGHFKEAADRAAEVWYPYPRKATPQEVNLSGGMYRYVDGQLQYAANCGRAALIWGHSMFTPADIRLLANLIKHPLVFEDDQT